jgi:hypothetical protein
MYQAQIAQHFESSVKRNTRRIGSILLPVAVMLMAVRPITSRWHTYDFSSKFLAAVFLLSLAIKPIFDYLAEVKVLQGNQHLSNSWDGYILVMIAILLFT